jgi:hypothetical protein
MSPIPRIFEKRADPSVESKSTYGDFKVSNLKPLIGNETTEVSPPDLEPRQASDAWRRRFR